LQGLLRTAVVEQEVGVVGDQEVVARRERECFAIRSGKWISCARPWSAWASRADHLRAAGLRGKADATPTRHYDANVEAALSGMARVWRT